MEKASRKKNGANKSCVFLNLKSNAFIEFGFLCSTMSTSSDTLQTRFPAPWGKAALNRLLS